MAGCGGGTGTGNGNGGTASPDMSINLSNLSDMASQAPEGSLGESCKNDSDCGGVGLTCTLPTANDPVFGGGPANGYCTKSCSKDGDCPSGGVCLQDHAGSHGTCVLTCKQGPTLVHLNDPITDMSKCNARVDVACTEIAPGRFACIPLCGADSQCPMGMHCDPRAATCVGTPHAGLANGKACDPQAATDPCAGTCTTLPSGAENVSICSQPCVLGVDPANAPTPTLWTACGGLQNGLCAFLVQREGAGDSGTCANACSKQDDCDNPKFFCFAVNGLTGKNGITNGWCFGATPCPNGDLDCMGFGSCVMTTYGPECLSKQFPLGSAGAGDGGMH
jgi:hypothetical protein